MSGVALLTLGGTISMVQEATSATPKLGAAQLAQASPLITKAVDVALVGGSEVDTAHLQLLGHQLASVQRPAVVTVGTDAIEETAAWLAWAGPWSYPVAVTGSMMPGGRSDSDGNANIVDAVTTVSTLQWSEPVVVFGGHVLLGREAVKVSGALRDAFSAPGRGPIGGVGPLGLTLWREPTPTRGFGAPPSPAPVVPLVIAAMGDDGVLLDTAVARSSRGVVVAANGAGNLPPAMAAVAVGAAKSDVPIVVATRAADAVTSPVYGYPGGSSELAEAGVIFASGLSPHRARIVVGLAIAHQMDVSAAIRQATADVSCSEQTLPSG